MYADARKLHVIEEVLKVKSEATLAAIENILKRSSETKVAKKESSFKDFSGIWSKEEALEMEKIIAESCETIHLKKRSINIKAYADYGSLNDRP